MNRLFWGLFFVLLNFNVTVGQAVFDIFPDFVGFVLMMKGMEDLADRSSFFDRGRHWAFGLSVASCIAFFWKLMDPGGMSGVWLWVMGLAILVLALLLVRWIVLGIREMQKNAQQERLGSMWLILAVILVICYLVNWVPLVGSICGIAAMVTGLLFLAVFYEAKKKSAE